MNPLSALPPHWPLSAGGEAAGIARERAPPPDVPMPLPRLHVEGKPAMKCGFRLATCGRFMKRS